VDITEVARRSGVAASTLRFYEQKGLIASIGRRGLRRVFAPNVLERLALIALGRAAGFSLAEIARMFAPDGQVRIDRQMLTARAEELEKTISKLSTMRDGLRHAAAGGVADADPVHGLRVHVGRKDLRRAQRQKHRDYHCPNCAHVCSCCVGRILARTPSLDKPASVHGCRAWRSTIAGNFLRHCVYECER
jgi:DNA-binding transcriptional MerR regulator